MGQYITAYLKAVEAALADESGKIDLDALKKEHLQQIEFIQHERLIHLMVTIMVIIILFIGLVIFFITSITAFAIVDALLLILAFCYLGYYFFIENTTQKLYCIYNRICLKIDEKNNKAQGLEGVLDKPHLVKYVGV